MSRKPRLTISQKLPWVREAVRGKRSTQSVPSCLSAWVGVNLFLPLTALAKNSWIYFLLATHLDISVHTVSLLTKIHCSGFPACQRACVWCHCYRGYKHYKATHKVLVICGCCLNSKQKKVFIHFSDLSTHKSSSFSCWSLAQGYSHFS